MNLKLSINLETLTKFKTWFNGLNHIKLVFFISLFLSIAATWFCYVNDYILLYGDAESHLNIAKRVMHSITPGFAQLGGIWLPLPHIMLVPFVYFDFLWRTGLAGSIVSGLSFIVSSIFIYRTALLISKNKAAAFFAALIFMLNPNILYMQTTPMTEVPLIMFFLLSTYYFLRYLKESQRHIDLIFAALFGFLATITRYDGWFLVAVELGVLGLFYFPWKRFPRSIGEAFGVFKTRSWAKLEGIIFLFSTLAFFGIGLWFAWDFLILGDPLYFTNSEFSAKSQQNAFLEAGQLPAYRHLGVAALYYFITSLSNVGVFLLPTALVGFAYYLGNKLEKSRYLVGLIIFIIFIFNVFTLVVGQSVIYIPSLTPTTFGTNLFNVRYGLLMLPFAAIFISYLYYKIKIGGKALIIALFVLQFGLYGIGYSKVITFEDGWVGVSSAERPEAERWMKRNYDGGLVLLDDYARTISIVRSGIPMQNIIYIGNKPYWGDALEEPENQVKWIPLKAHDAVSKVLYEDPVMKERLYQNFDEVYSEKEIKIFKRKW